MMKYIIALGPQEGLALLQELLGFLIALRRTKDMDQ